MERKLITQKLSGLENEKMKLLQAFYLNAIDINLLKKEQERISKETTMLENKLGAITIKNENYSKVIEIATKMASNCYKAYKRAKPQTKRMLNQAFFRKIYINTKAKDISKVEFSEVFDLFFNKRSNKETLAPRAGLEPATHGLHFAPMFP